MYSRLNHSVTILDGQTTSEAVDFDGRILESLQPDSGWNTANITFSGSIDGTNYATVQNTSGTAITLTGVVAEEIFTGLSDPLKGVRFIKVVSGVAQTGDTVITLCSVPTV